MWNIICSKKCESTYFYNTKLKIKCINIINNLQNLQHTIYKIIL